jgi:hypothetical protein
MFYSIPVTRGGYAICTVPVEIKAGGNSLSIEQYERGNSF